MTPITFNDQLVPATPVDRELWRTHFERYITYVDREKGWQVFLDDLNKGETLVSSVAQHGMKAKGSDKILEGLSRNIYVATWRRWIGLQKVPAIADMVAAELNTEKYDKIVLFCSSKAVVEELRHALRHHGAVSLFNGTPWQKRERQMRKFAGDKHTHVCVCRYDGANTATDFSMVSQVGCVESDWSSIANNHQAMLRVHNGAQKNPVTVRYFSIPGTMDEKVQRMVKQYTRRAIENPFGFLCE